MRECQMKSEAVLKLFRDSGALLDGHFILSSGLHSRNYLQCARVLMDAKRAARLCKALAGKVKQEINKEIAQIEEARDLFETQFKEEEEAIALELDQLGKTRELTNDDFVDAIERTDALESKKNLEDAKEILKVLKFFTLA